MAFVNGGLVLYKSININLPNPTMSLSLCYVHTNTNIYYMFKDSFEESYCCWKLLVCLLKTLFVAYACEHKLTSKHLQREQQYFQENKGKSSSFSFNFQSMFRN